MSGVNSSIVLVGTDFDQIKTNFISYLRSQNVLKDANYTGSALSILLDILSYNTHYNAYYLNMLSNDMFLDTAFKRNSVISHAKSLGYFPRSATCTSTIVDITVTGIEDNYFYIPRHTKFLSEKVGNNKNYTFVTTTDYLVNVDVNGSVVVQNVVLKQGEPISYSFVYDAIGNPTSIFSIPDENIDIDTLKVTVQNSLYNIDLDVYTKIDDPLALTGDSKVYYIQEGFDGKYEIYFGNNILGKALQDGNIINVSYLSTSGSIAEGAASFYLIDELVGSYNTFSVVASTPAIGGMEKETISEIKYAAPKTYYSQGRAVTTEDYKSLILRNSREFQVESVSVWSGEDNIPPIYGKVFIAMKLQGGFTVTATQKERIIEDIIKPISVITTEPVIVDVDYSYLNINNTYLYNKSKTNLSENELTTKVIDSIKLYADENLNNFNSTLVLSDLINYINASDPSIITNESSLYLEKKFSPTFDTKGTYTFNFAVPIVRNFTRNNIKISPSIQVYDESEKTIRSEVFLEEIPTSATSIKSITILNQGYGYTSPPTVTIVGDGSGATATAELLNGRISKIIIQNYGINYTQAIVSITGGGGYLGAANVVLENQYGDLRLYYYNNIGVKTILTPYIGSVDYYNGTVTLSDFIVTDINNSTGVLGIYIKPDTTIISSEKNSIISLDTSDATAIRVTAKRR